MAHPHETNPQGKPDTMRVVHNEGSGNAAWFIAGAVVIALVIVAFVIGGNSADDGAPVGAEGADPAAVQTDTGEATTPEAAAIPDAEVAPEAPAAEEAAPAAEGESTAN